MMKSYQMLVDVLPVISGAIIGWAGKCYRRKLYHNSVLRAAILWGETHHAKVRSNNAAVVNGKPKPLNFDGEEKSILQKMIGYYAVVGVLVIALAFVYQLMAEMDPRLNLSLGDEVGFWVGLLVVLHRAHG